MNTEEKGREIQQVSITIKGTDELVALIFIDETDGSIKQIINDEYEVTIKTRPKTGND